MRERGVDGSKNLLAILKLNCDAAWKNGKMFLLSQLKMMKANVYRHGEESVDV